MNQVDDPNDRSARNPEAKLDSEPSANSDATLGSSTAFDASTATAAARLPASIGPYRLVRRLGDGGLGQVWLADQTQPVKRTVALKLIKVGSYDDEVLQRFRSERQSLAMMDHPAIAKVFDAGATPDGQPYFVMEYVPGVPITTYCDEKRLTIRQRLELSSKFAKARSTRTRRQSSTATLSPRTFWSRKWMARRCRASSISAWPRPSGRKSPTRPC